MTPEEYLEEQKREGEKEWSRLEAMVKSGRHPTMHELAAAIFRYGLEPVTDAAHYVAGRMVEDIKAPRGNSGGPRRNTIDDYSLRLLYKIELEELQIFRKSNPREFRNLYDKRTPSKVACQHIARQFNVGQERIRKLPKQSGD